MNQQTIPTGQNTANGSTARKTSQTWRRLHFTWLRLQQVLCLLLVAFDLVVLLVSLPGFYTLLSSYCMGDETDCPPDGKLSASDFHVIASLHLSLSTYVLFSFLFGLFCVLVFVTVGLLLLGTRFDQPYCLFTAFWLITFGTSIINTSFSESLRLAHPYTFMIVLWQYIEPCAWFLLVPFFLLFPDGRFVPRWIWLLFLPFSLLFITYKLPASSPFYISRLNFWFEAVLSVFAFGGCLAVLIYRYIRVSTFEQRQQTKWVVLGFALVVAIVAVPSSSTGESGLSRLLDISTFPNICFLPIPLSIGIAMLYSRLWDIDRVINRILVYSILSAIVIAVYSLVVVGIGSLLHVQDNLLLSLIATGLVAILFQPLRQRLQRLVNRLLFGYRDEPYRVLSQLSKQLEATISPDLLLDTIVKTIARALKLPASAIVSGGESGSLVPISASYGVLSEEKSLIRVPLIYQTETVGELLLSPRTPGEALTSADQRLLHDLTPQIGVALHAVRLTAHLKQVNADLQRSREQLVTAREEERRRLRRDLHDGLGPTLAALNLQAGMLRTLMTQDVEAANTLVSEWRVHLREVIADIRQLVYELRPPALDELGLVGAIKEQAASYTTNYTSNTMPTTLSIRILVEVDEDFPPLTAAIEVATYRIATEAMTNVVRHAQAHLCTLRIWVVADILSIECIDDGIGIPKTHQIGIGLLSMQERASELGGSCSIEAVEAGGTRVFAYIPLPKE